MFLLTGSIWHLVAVVFTWNIGLILVFKMLDFVHNFIFLSAFLIKYYISHCMRMQENKTRSVSHTLNVFVQALTCFIHIQPTQRDSPSMLYDNINLHLEVGIWSLWNCSNFCFCKKSGKILIILSAKVSTPTFWIWGETWFECDSSYNVCSNVNFQMAFNCAQWLHLIDSTVNQMLQCPLYRKWSKRSIVTCIYDKLHKQPNVNANIKPELSECVFTC